MSEYALFLRSNGMAWHGMAWQGKARQGKARAEARAEAEEATTTTAAYITNTR